MIKLFSMILLCSSVSGYVYVLTNHKCLKVRLCLMLRMLPHFVCFLPEGLGHMILGFQRHFLGFQRIMALEHLCCYSTKCNSCDAVEKRRDPEPSVSSPQFDTKQT